MPWVVNVDQDPLAVLEVTCTDDVVAAVRWAVEHSVAVTAQPTGHGASGPMRDTLLLRTRALGEIIVDTQARTAWVGAGVKSGELLAALDGTGLTFLAGSNPDPSVVAMTITGGISWFGRAYGLGCDSIRAVEIVDGLGRVRRVSDDDDADLFWALRGGGGAFGIITRIEIDLHPAPATTYGGRLLWPVEAMPEVLSAFAAVTEQAPAELSLWYHTYRFPPLPDVPEPLRGNAFASVAIAFLGNAAGAEDVLAPLHGIPGLVMDLTCELPVAALGSIADEPTDPMPALKHSALLERLDDALIERLTAAVGADSDCPLAVFQIRHLGAAFGANPTGQGCHGPVTESYLFWALGVPAVPELGAAVTGSFAAIDAACEGYASGRTLLNFLGAGGDPGRWWSPQTRERLAQVKGASDPYGLIVSNRPVEPGT